MRLKNTLEATNSRITEAEDRISEVEDRMVDINKSERKKEKLIKRNEDNLRDLWDNVYPVITRWGPCSLQRLKRSPTFRVEVRNVTWHP